MAVTKSPVFASYPLTYARSFNGHPTEVLLLLLLLPLLLLSGVLGGLAGSRNTAQPDKGPTPALPPGTGACMQAIIVGSSCEDGWLSANPTCGFAKYTDANGYKQDVA